MNAMRCPEHMQTYHILSTTDVHVVGVAQTGGLFISHTKSTKGMCRCCGTVELLTAPRWFYAEPSFVSWRGLARLAWRKIVAASAQRTPHRGVATPEGAR